MQGTGSACRLEMENFQRFDLKLAKGPRQERRFVRRDALVASVPITTPQIKTLKPIIRALYTLSSVTSVRILHVLKLRTLKT